MAEPGEVFLNEPLNAALPTIGSRVRHSPADQLDVALSTILTLA